MNSLTARQEKWNLIIFTISKFIAAMGGSMYTFGMGLYILKLTGSAGNFALALICGTLPRIFTGPLAGVWADRFSKKKIIIMAQAVQAMTLLSLFVVSFQVSISLPLIYGTMVVMSICTTFSSITFTSSIMNLVQEKSVQKAMSFNQSASSSAYILGPVLGGALYAFISIETFILISGVMYVVVNAFDLMLRFTKNEKNVAQKGVWEEMKEGFAFVRGHVLLRQVIFPVALWVNFFMIGMEVGLPYVTVNVLQLSSVQVGIVEAALAVGMLLTSMFLSIRKEAKNPLETMKFNLLLLGALVVAMALPLVFSWPSFVPFVYYFLLRCAVGMSIVCLNTPLYVLLQKTTPEAYKGRVFGVMETMVMIISPFGMGLYGMLFNYVNPMVLFSVSGLMVIAVTMYQMRAARLRYIEIDNTTEQVVGV